MNFNKDLTFALVSASLGKLSEANPDKVLFTKHFAMEELLSIYAYADMRCEGFPPNETLAEALLKLTMEKSLDAGIIYDIAPIYYNLYAEALNDGTVQAGEVPEFYQLCFWMATQQ